MARVMGPMHYRFDEEAKMSTVAGHMGLGGTKPAEEPLEEPRPSRTRRIVRVLVYEGPEDRVIDQLRRRGVKGSQPIAQDPRMRFVGVTVSERFVHHDDVLRMLGEDVTAAEMAQAMSEASGATVMPNGSPESKQFIKALGSEEVKTKP